MLNNTLTIKVSLAGKKNEKDAIETIENAFGINFGVVPVPNWDGFNDDMRSFEGFSFFWRDKIKEDPKLNTLHLIIANAGDFKNFSPKDYQILREILEEKTEPEHRYDKVKFTYEIHDGEMISAK